MQSFKWKFLHQKKVLAIDREGPKTADNRIKNCWQRAKKTAETGPKTVGRWADRPKSASTEEVRSGWMGLLIETPLCIWNWISNWKFWQKFWLKHHFVLPRCFCGYLRDETFNNEEDAESHMSRTFFLVLAERLCLSLEFLKWKLKFLLVNVNLWTKQSENYFNDPRPYCVLNSALVDYHIKNEKRNSQNGN